MANVSALEPLKEASMKQLNEQKAARTLAKSDKNKDGKIQKDEGELFWRRNARHDKNGDGALDLEELKQIGDPQIDSKGRKLLNVIFKRTPQGPVYLDFYFPEKDAGSDKPVVIFTHGGGWAAGNKSKAGSASFNEVHKALLNEGFCVLSVGYRKVSKDGDTAMRDCVIDSKDALRFISAHHEELGIDPNKIHAFGDSAGGQMAQMIALSPSESLKGDKELAKFDYKTVSGVSWYGPCDFQDEQLFNHDDRAGFRDRFGPRIMGAGSKPEEKEQRYREMSPVSYLTKDSPPLLMIQGDKDTTIPVKQAYRMQEALKTIDAPVEVLIVKNAGHNWRSVDAPIEPTRAEIIERTIQFFLKHR
ncbi:prolyl oligopeptidase family serine peptidase [Haloferula sp.]|uniref:prolyl oligopeptidase family serine peptidase n=1 Tax=Haloferula sp. TaxID=2497595 RepID=UPI00329ABB61